MDGNPAIGQCRNLGPYSAQMLAQVGITDYAQLKALGSVQAYVRVKGSGQKASLNLLYALEGALLDLHWNALPKELKAHLKKQVGQT